MLGSLHHIELYVSNLKKSKEFWGWLLSELGYKVYQEWDSGISYILGKTYLVLVQTEDAYQDIPYHRKRTGLNHLAFRLSSRADVDAYATALKERSVPILYEDRHPYAGGSDYYAVFFEDPDRIKVELVADENT